MKLYKTQSQTIGSLLVVSPLLVLASMASAAMTHSSIQSVTVSGGITSPSFSTAPFSNPAGVVANGGSIFTVQAGGDNSLSNPMIRGGLAYGNGKIGLAGGASIRTSSNNSDAYFGLGVGFDSANIQIGFSGTVGISPSGGSSFNAGLLFMPTHSFTLGFTARDFANSGGIGELGAGLGVQLNQNVSFIVDSAFSHNLNYLGIQPGIKVGMETAALTVSYGAGSGSSQLANDAVSIGASINFMSHILWEVYYNRFTTFYTGLSFQF